MCLDVSLCHIILTIYPKYWVQWGHAVAQLVEALCYKPEGRGFDSRWCHWIFSLTYSFRRHYGPGVDSASNRNEYQECFLGVKAACAQGWQPYYLHVPIVLISGSLKLLETSGSVQAVMGLLYLLLIKFIIQPDDGQYTGPKHVVVCTNLCDNI